MEYGNQVKRVAREADDWTFVRLGNWELELELTNLVGSLYRHSSLIQFLHKFNC